MIGHNYNGTCLKCGKTHKHPKGMGGKHHTKEAKTIMRKNTINQWKNMSPETKKERARLNSIVHSGEKNGMFGKTSRGFFGRKHCQKSKELIGKASMGRIFSNESRNKQSLVLKGRKFSKETKKNMRESAIKRIEIQKLNGHPLIPSIGKNEPKILDSIERKQKIKIVRQFKVRGFFVDGYCNETNTVYEVDEKFHFIDNSLRQKDILRQHEIEEELNCQFVRIKDLGVNI